MGRFGEGLTRDDDGEGFLRGAGDLAILLSGASGSGRIWGSAPSGREIRRGGASGGVTRPGMAVDSRGSQALAMSAETKKKKKKRSGVINKEAHNSSPFEPLLLRRYFSTFFPVLR